MRLRFVLLAVALVIGWTGAQARRMGCDDAVLPPDQRWNGGVSYSTPALDRFYDLSEEMSAAYQGGDRSLARSLALHNANVILGLIALRSGRKAEAVVHLYAAGETPGSPQLNTFGPSLLLARELAKAGEYKAASAYLVSVSRFWKAKDRSFVGFMLPQFADPDPIATWISELEHGRVPDFGAPFNMDPP